LAQVEQDYDSKVVAVRVLRQPAVHTRLVEEVCAGAAPVPLTARD